ALLSASRALGGYQFDPAMGAARLGTGRLSSPDARKHRLGPARDHDAGRQMSFLLPALMLVGLAAALFSGLPVAVVLIGVAFLFAGVGILGRVVVGLQRPAAGRVAASTGSRALSALPPLRRHGYGTEEAAGLVAAAGTLGVVAPPGIMLFFVADAIGAQVPALFLAMLGPLAL